MKNTVIKLNESEFKNIIIEAVKNTLSEMNWQTYINAARGFYDAGDIEKAHKLEKYAQEMFQKEHGKNGYSHQYEYDSPSYGGRHDYSDSDKDFEVKSPTKDGYWYGEKAKIRNYQNKGYNNCNDWYPVFWNFNNVLLHKNRYYNDSDLND